MRILLMFAGVVACAAQPDSKMPASRSAAAVRTQAAPQSAPARAAVPANINDRWISANGAEAKNMLERDGREVYAARDQILAALALQPGQNVADVGAGSGLFTRLFAKAVGPTGTVYAVDIGEKLLAHIDAEAKAAGQTNIRTVLGTAHTTSLPSTTIDVVFISDTYHHFEYPEAMLASIKTALKAGGKLVIIDFKRVEGESSDWILKHVRAGQTTVVGEVEAAGFQQLDTVEVPGLAQNYFVVFAKRASDEPT